MKEKLLRTFSKMNGKRVAVAVVVTMMGGGSCLFAQTQWVDVTEEYLVNADFSLGTSEGWKDGTTEPKVDATWLNAEFYGKKEVSALQNVLGLRPGNYKLTVRAFQRVGGNDGGAAYEAGTENIDAYLVAGENEVKLPSLYSVKNPVDVPRLKNGYIDNMEGMSVYCAKYPEGYNAEVEFTVDELKSMLMGIEVRTGQWVIWDDFKLYYEGTAFDAFRIKVSRMEVLRDSLTTLRFAAASELDGLVQKYGGYSESTPESEINAAVEDVTERTAFVMELLPNMVKLNANLQKGEALLAKLESGVIILPAETKELLKTTLAGIESVQAFPTLAEVKEKLEETIQTSDENLAKVNTLMGLSYPLQTAKNLADRIGGLNASEEYKKVEADLNSTELTYDDMMLDVHALTALCQEKMTPAFLATANADNPIDLTSFVANPNIFQNGEITEMPGGWTMVAQGSADNKNMTTEAHTDTQIHGGSWSGNAANNIANIHYQQIIGGDEEGALKLPDGLYELSAATYVSAKGENIMLYATNDEVSFATAWFNNDREVYDVAREKLETTTKVVNVVVNGGKLYIGIKGTGIVGGNGQEFLADNFRLSYVGADALVAYRERLQKRLDEAVIWHDSLQVYGIDDSDYYGIALDPVDGYPAYLEEGTVEDITTAIDELDEMNASAKTVIDNYLKFYPMVTNGNNLLDQLSGGVLYAQPTVSEKFMTVLENAAIVAEDMTWDNLISDAVTEQMTLLEGAIKDLMNSMAVCYPMGTAKELADQIGGLSDHAAYKDVVNLLKSDDLDPLDVDMSVKDLQDACISAMTPEVLAKATAENPLNMTTFVVNPNIYQDAVNEDGAPIRSVINGWTCETNADAPDRTDSTGDTWLWCYSWSGHADHNIGLGTDYRQMVGTQIGEEGKFALPKGAYRVEAATFAGEQAEKLELYAKTHDVTVSSETNEDGVEVPVYTYNEIETVVSPFNGDEDAWNAAQATLGITTAINEIFVDKGALTIGVKGNAVVSGNGKTWYADNFRLYYIGENKGSGIEDTMMNTVDSTSEFIDVYDIMGNLVRKQVKRTDAVKGLKKGIYIVGGRKCVVAGE